MRHLLGILVDLGAHRAAAVLHGALVAAGAAAALPFEPGDAKQLAAEANRARDVLGPAEFAAAVRSGAAMSDADTVAYVKSEIDRLLRRAGRRGMTNLDDPASSVAERRTAFGHHHCRGLVAVVAVHPGLLRRGRGPNLDPETPVAVGAEWDAARLAANRS